MTWDGTMHWIDANIDGTYDQTAIDSGGDGRVDIWQMDQDQDGLVDMMAFDMNGDGLADSWMHHAEVSAVGDWSGGWQLPVVEPVATMRSLAEDLSQTTIGGPGSVWPAPESVYVPASIHPSLTATYVAGSGGSAASVPHAGGSASLANQMALGVIMPGLIHTYYSGLNGLDAVTSPSYIFP